MIHPTALISAEATVSADASIGPFAVVEGKCTIGAGTLIDAHTVVRGSIVIGKNCKIGPGTYVGMAPQHLGFDQSIETWVVIGDGVIVREGASIHRATKPGMENATTIGNKVFMMGDSHVGHDCRVADSVTLAHGARLGGHCLVGERAFIGGGAGIHQFCRVGRGAIIAANELVTHDIPPFAAARYGGLKAYNHIGCRRAGMTRETLHALRQAYHCIHTERTLNGVVRAIEALELDVPEVRELVEFLTTSRRGIQPSVRFLDRTGALEGDDAFAGGVG